MMSPIANNEEHSLVIDNAATQHAHFVLTPASSNASSNTSGEQKSQCSSLSDGENFEWAGDENNREAHGGDRDGHGLAVNHHLPGVTDNINSGTEGRSPSNINRHAWLRTSLRRSTPNNSENLSSRRWGSFRHNGRRQNLGSNALASQLYRSSSFNSSGRSSTCDTTDDMYSDASLEEDVHDLHHKFQVLQQQVGVLQDSAHQNDERYTRVKAENAALQARVIMLEEQLRDTELRCDEKIQDEQKRSKELLHRTEREKQLQLENSSIRLENSESECEKLKEEITRQRLRIEKLETQKEELLNQVHDLAQELNESKEDVKNSRDRESRLIKDQHAQISLLEDLGKEIERLKLENRTPALPTTSAENLRLEELHEEMALLRAQNGHLQETNEELQANLLHASLETGRILTNGEHSLAHELDVMSQDEVQRALKEQQEVNRQLRTYIEGILLNIVENHPQLLEVKQKSAVSG